MTVSLVAHIAGVGFWANGLPSWADATQFVRTGVLPEDAPAKPSPQLLPPNERRRAPESVAVALDVAMAACDAAGRDPASLPSVFASTHGDLAITDYMCATLASDPRAISPTKFHNSVHNAAAGYWTIGAHCMHAATAISAYDGSFAQGLVEALAQLATGTDAVLLVAYDTAAAGALGSVHGCRGLLGGALVLTRSGNGPQLRARLLNQTVAADAAGGPLSRHSADNAMSPMLPLFDALAIGDGRTMLLPAGAGTALQLEIVDASCGSSQPSGRGEA